MAGSPGMLVRQCSPTGEQCEVLFQKVRLTMIASPRDWEELGTEYDQNPMCETVKKLIIFF